MSFKLQKSVDTFWFNAILIPSIIKCSALHQVNALRKDKKFNIPTLTICNAPESSMTCESDLVFLTHAGPEIGVASTKAFTTQLVSLALLLTAIGRVQKRMS